MGEVEIAEYDIINEDLVYVQGESSGTVFPGELLHALHHGHIGTHTHTTHGYTHVHIVYREACKNSG